MSAGISVVGIGAVSAAGWGVQALCEAVRSGAEIERSILTRESFGETVNTPVLRVPEPGANVPKFPRLRRASPISKYAAAAVIEAVPAERLASSLAGEFRIGVITTLMNGCVIYSNRFYREVLNDPGIASPILFPETVFNAPSSHLSALLGSTSPNDTLIGDGAEFFTGLELAAEWIGRGEVDGCIVVGNEEIDWLSSEALRFYSRDYVPSEGAAALYLEAGDHGPQLLQVPDPLTFSGARARVDAARQLRVALDANDDGRTLLVDGRCGVLKHDQPENLAWVDWQGLKFSPRRIIGESLGASAAFQCAVAIDAIRSGQFERAVVTSVGGNEQAAGAVFGARPEPLSAVVKRPSAVHPSPS
ncbi:MAG: hypothetical protein WCH40_04790 [Verrucomicrobiales bacterium]